MLEIEELIAQLAEVPGTVEQQPGKASGFSAAIPSEQDVDRRLEAEYLMPSHELTWDSLDVFQTRDLASLSVYGDARDKFVNHMVALPALASRTAVRFRRKGIAGEIHRCEETVDVTRAGTDTATNSFAMTRKYDAGKGSGITGSTKNLPFQPGGLASVVINDAGRALPRDERGFFYAAPGLSRGLRLDGTGGELPGTLEAAADGDGSGADGRADGSADGSAAAVRELKVLDHGELKSQIQADGELDALVPTAEQQAQFLSGGSAKKAAKHNWAHMVDLDHTIDNFEELVPNMARTWPFELDTFQKEAVYHLEQGDSVFVAAHTSAGKTVVAEYAIAMANRNMTKCIYTSPIKALSNQKFRDFKDEGQDVGLITGDVQINPEANCLIMTTEILRSMLYRGADLIRDVEFVVFDEVHYVNDVDRGVVWEEVIIMLPDHVKLILLSATVPNTFEFASWIGRTKHKDIYVISTPKRPVPLEISIWAKRELFKVVDADKHFVADGFKRHAELYEKPKSEVKAAGAQQAQRGGAAGGRGSGARGSNARGGRGGGAGSRGGRGGGRGGGSSGAQAPPAFRQFQRDGPNKSSWMNLVRYLEKKQLLPVVVFVFSKKRCEEYCDTLSTIEFTNNREKSEIHMFINRSVAMLKKEDRELPQILKVRDMLSRGIAVHHGGLLPIVKECIEILFARGLVKVLFATETFAMGLNLPTRTVVFSELRKHDGRGFRNLLPGEFIQMAGRAGRRGLDTTGTVIVMSYSQPVVQEQLKEVTLGTPTKLQSQFRLTYNMILNLLRVEALRVEEMIKRSFSENTTQSLLPEHQRSIIALETKLQKLKLDPCTSCPQDKLHAIFASLMDYKRANGKVIAESFDGAKSRQVYTVGRLLLFRDEHRNVVPGFVIKSAHALKKLVVLTNENVVDNRSDLPYLTAIPGYVAKFFNRMTFKPNDDLKFVEVPLADVEFVSRFVLKVNINAILNEDEAAIAKAHEEIQLMLTFQRKWHEFDFKKSSTLKLHGLLAEKRAAEEFLKKELPSVWSCPDLSTHLEQLLQKRRIEEEIVELKSLVSDDNMELLPDYEQRLSVLKELGFVDENLNVVLKGRVACEINSGWELALTELLLDNFLVDFTSEEIIALLSVFVYEGKTNDEEEIAVTPKLDKGKSRIKEIMANLLEVYNKYQIPLTKEEEEFLDRKRFNLVRVVYEWSRGMTFNEIMTISNEAEGTIVRVITRLDEICREVKNAALIIGDNSLHAKMSEAQEKIKRDIVFCASLYL